MLSTVKQCGRNIDSAIFKGTDQTLSYDTLAAEAPAYTITDVASSYLYIVDGHTAEMLYHPTKEKVGKAVENEAVKTLLSQIKEGKHPEPDIIEYEFNGTLKYAAYWVGINEEYIAVITADESDVLSGISKITQNSMMVYASSVIFWIIIALFSARAICKPLRKIVDILADFAKGDFTADIKIHSILKETNQLIGAAINLKENMSASISNVDNSTKNLLRDTDRVNDAINLCNSAAENVNIAVTEPWIWLIMHRISIHRWCLLAKQFLQQMIWLLVLKQRLIRLKRFPIQPWIHWNLY